MLPPKGIEEWVQRAKILPAREGRGKGFGEKQSRNWTTRVILMRRF
jgi:hypothetical protein